MRTMNINLTDEQAKLVEQTSRKYGFANRSELLRALLRYVYKMNPTLVKTAVSFPFAEPIREKRLPTLEEIKNKIIPILQNHDVEFAGIFGSYARREAKLESDVDLLYRYSTPKSLLYTVGLQQKLSEALGGRVDLISEKFLKPNIRGQVLKDLKILYGQRQYI